MGLPSRIVGRVFGKFAIGTFDWLKRVNLAAVAPFADQARKLSFVSADIEHRVYPVSLKYSQQVRHQSLLTANPHNVELQPLVELKFNGRNGARKQRHCPPQLIGSADPASVLQVS